MPRSSVRSIGVAWLLVVSAASMPGCTSTDAGTSETTELAAGRLKERALAGRKPGARGASNAANDARSPEALAVDEALAAEEEDGYERGAFDFGAGPVRRSPRRRASAPERSEATSGPATQGDPAAPVAPCEDEPQDLGDPTPFPSAQRGIRVVWEALAVEREQVENPRFGRRQLKGVRPDLKIVLVSPGHPAALAREQGRAATRDPDGSQVAVLGEAEMRALVQGLRQIGFFEVARPSGSMSSQYQNREARGRVTVEVAGESRTVLSLRGQGASSVSKDIPRIYSEAKQAIAALRNSTPTLNVTTVGGQQGKPRIVPRKRGESRVLSDEEAAEILGGEAQGRPADPDDWGLGR